MVEKNDFDLIVAFDVIEHLYDPKLMIQILDSKLRKGGKIICTFPNKDSLVAKLKKEKWAMVRPFGHLHFFSRKSVRKLFGAPHFKIIEMRGMLPGDESIKKAIQSLDYTSLKFIPRAAKRIILGRDQWVVEVIKI